MVLRGEQLTKMTCLEEIKISLVGLGLILSLLGSQELRHQVQNIWAWLGWKQAVDFPQFKFYFKM